MIKASAIKIDFANGMIKEFLLNLPFEEKFFFVFLFFFFSFGWQSVWCAILWVGGVSRIVGCV